MCIVIGLSNGESIWFDLLYIFCFFCWFICIYFYLQFLIIFRWKKKLILDFFSLVIVNFLFPQKLHILSILMFFDKQVWLKFVNNDFIYTLLNQGNISEYRLCIEELKLVVFCFIWFLKNKLISLFNLLIYFLNLINWIWYLIYLNLFLFKKFLYFSLVLFKGKIGVNWRADWIKDVEDETIEWDHSYSYLDLEYVYIYIKITFNTMPFITCLMKITSNIQ